MAFVTLADGTRLYYEESGDGEPLLLVNGQGMDHTSWRNLRDDFTDRYHVIVFDHRGTRLSDKPIEPAYITHGLAASGRHPEPVLTDGGGMGNDRQ